MAFRRTPAINDILVYIPLIKKHLITIVIYVRFEAMPIFLGHSRATDNQWDCTNKILG